MRVLISLTLLQTLVLACGTNTKESGLLGKSLLADGELTKESVNVNLSEALDALVDSNMAGGSASTLALHKGKGEDHDGSQREKSCKVEGNNAVVTISSSIDRGFSHDGRVLAIDATREGSSKIVRTWSKEGGSVACKDEKRADIDMSADLTGMKLSVTFERSMQRSLEITKKAKSSGNSGGQDDKGGADKTKDNAAAGNSSSSAGDSNLVKKSFSMSAKGTRDVSWTKQETNADGSITRTKTIVSKSERSHTRLDKEGKEQTLNFTIEIGSEAPLQISVTYEDELKDRDIKSKLVSSGSITASRSGDGKIVSTFDNLLLNFDDKECSPFSGKMTSKIYKEGENTPAKIFELKAEDGEYTLEDVTDPAKPVAVDDIDFEMCDITDHRD